MARLPLRAARRSRAELSGTALRPRWVSAFVTALANARMRHVARRRERRQCWVSKVAFPLAEAVRRARGARIRRLHGVFCALTAISTVRPDSTKREERVGCAR